MNRLFTELQENGKVLVFGHRGLSEYYPENTMLSFSKCAENPLNDGIELDVHICKSGEIVVAHDFSLKRTAGIDREIESFTYQELQAIDVGSFKGEGFADCRVPLLADLFHTFGKRFLYDVELKVKAGQVNRELSQKVYELIRDFGLQDNVMVSSFNPVALRAFRKVSGATMDTADIFTISPTIPKVLQKGAGRFVSHATYQKPGLEVIDDIYIKEHGKLPIITWTVNKKEDVKRLLKYNENGPMKVFGMIGNDPNMISEILNH
ncbi:MAG: glycerophosphodiester phosphodiesterase [Sphaerochaetaceae bacterium]|nr:glycerophosphodiester phosphodiesterase [Sphaerochaetaceae bacterium]